MADRLESRGQGPVRHQWADRWHRATGGAYRVSGERMSGVQARSERVASPRVKIGCSLRDRRTRVNRLGGLRTPGYPP